MKLLPVLLILLTPVLSRGKGHEMFQEKAIKLQITDFSPELRYFLFHVSYAAPMAVLSSASHGKGLDIRNGKGAPLKDISVNSSLHSYELGAGKGVFRLGVLIRDKAFPKDGRIQIKGKLPVKCARLAALPEIEIELRRNAAYSIPLFIPPFAEERADVANLEKCPRLNVHLSPYPEPGRWSVGLTYPVSFPYAGMEFFDQRGRRIPVKTEPAPCRSGPVEFNPFICTFPEKHDCVRLVIQYAEKQATRNLPINATVSREDALKAIPPHPEGGRIP